MKEIKTKPKSEKPKLLDGAAKAPKTAMKNVWLATKQKAVSEIKNAPFDNQSSESTNAQTNTAGEQLLTDRSKAARRGASLAYRGGKKLAQATSSKLREQREIGRAAENLRKGGGSLQEAASPSERIKTRAEVGRLIKGRSKDSVKFASRFIKGSHQATRGITTAQSAAKRTHQAQKTQRMSMQTIKQVRQTAKAAVRTTKAVAHAVAAAVKATIAALQSLVTAIAGGGVVAVVIVLLICLIALLTGSAFGIFFGAEDTGTGMSIPQAVNLLNGEYRDQLQEIIASVPHDRQEITSNDGGLAIQWERVLAVFSAKVTGADDGSQVAALGDAQLNVLRTVLWDMNKIRHSARTESSEVEVTEIDENGNEIINIVTVTETILKISITHKTPEEMARHYGFNARQNEYLSLMVAPENASLWAELLGGFIASGEDIIHPSTDWEATGIFQWPLPETFSIASHFGYRVDPFTGATEYHNGTDIAAPAGTPILAAASGTVTIANAVDSWGGGYGYYITVQHDNVFDSLYAHCSAICIVPGQQVQQGEAIGYVGSTGNSTGNHLHFEVWQDGDRVDGLSFFNAKDAHS